MSVDRAAFNDDIALKILKIVDLAHLHQIAIDGELEYQPQCRESRSLIDFDPRTKIRHLSTKVNSSGGTYQIRLRALGTFADTLKNHGVSDVIKIGLINEKFRSSIWITDVQDVTDILRYSIYQPKLQSPNTKQALLDELEKILVEQGLSLLRP